MAVDLRTQVENLRAIQDPSSSLHMAMENTPQQETIEQRGSTRETMMVDPNLEARNVTQIEEPPDMGWCRIIEEPIDE